MTVHNFQDSLALSEKHADAPWWREVYTRAFPDLDSMTYVKRDGWAQRGGIDRVLTLSSGKTIYIDEKVRSEKWPDILLERWSSQEARTPGWVQKQLATDFIAYAFIPTQQCYLLPFPLLQRAWRNNGREWAAAAKARRDGFRVVLSDNGTYTTENIAVPIDVLQSAIADAAVFTWTTEAA